MAHTRTSWRNITATSAQRPNTSTRCGSAKPAPVSASTHRRSNQRHACRQRAAATPGAARRSGTQRSTRECCTAADGCSGGCSRCGASTTSSGLSSAASTDAVRADVGGGAATAAPAPVQRARTAGGTPAAASAIATRHGVQYHAADGTAASGTGRQRRWNSASQASHRMASASLPSRRHTRHAAPWRGTRVLTRVLDRVATHVMAGAQPRTVRGRWRRVRHGGGCRAVRRGWQRQW